VGENMSPSDHATVAATALVVLRGEITTCLRRDIAVRRLRNASVWYGSASSEDRRTFDRELSESFGEPATGQTIDSALNWWPLVEAMG